MVERPRRQHGESLESESHPGESPPERDLKIDMCMRQMLENAERV